jgi:hypothetical protein
LRESKDFGDSGALAPTNSPPDSAAAASAVHRQSKSFADSDASLESAALRDSNINAPTSGFLERQGAVGSDSWKASDGNAWLTEEHSPATDFSPSRALSPTISFGDSALVISLDLRPSISVLTTRDPLKSVQTVQTAPLPVSSPQNASEGSLPSAAAACSVVIELSAVPVATEPHPPSSAFAGVRFGRTVSFRSFAPAVSDDEAPSNAVIFSGSVGQSSRLAESGIKLWSIWLGESGSRDDSPALEKSEALRDSLAIEAPAVIPLKDSAVAFPASLWRRLTDNGLASLSLPQSRAQSRSVAFVPSRAPDRVPGTPSGRPPSSEVLAANDDAGGKKRLGSTIIVPIAIAVILLIALIAFLVWRRKGRKKTTAELAHDVEMESRGEGGAPGVEHYYTGNSDFADQPSGTNCDEFDDITDEFGEIADEALLGI